MLAGDIAAGLTGRGHRVTFLCEPGSPLENRLSSSNVECLPLPMGGYADLGSVRRIRKWLRTNKADVFHSHYSKDLWTLAPALAGHPGIPLFLTKHIGTQSKSKLVCARCGWLMDIEPAEDVEVDVCLKCGGVWLDYGELEKLKAISKAGFKPDELAKAEERWEELAQKERESVLLGLFNRLSRR